MPETYTPLEDLLSGKERLLTTGEVAEILNINVNTLYLWRASPEVNLPFQRFIAPDQKRGMIRYRYSDVAKFLAAAEEAGKVPETPEGAPQGSTTRVVEVVLSDAEELAEFEARKAAAEKRAARRRQKGNKSKRNAMKDTPLEKLLQTPKAQVQNVPAPVEGWESPVPTEVPLDVVTHEPLPGEPAPVTGNIELPEVIGDADSEQTRRMRALAADALADILARINGTTPEEGDNTQ